MNKFLDEYEGLRTIINENPTLPIMFMASDDCGNPDYAWNLSSAKAKVEHVAFGEERIYFSEDDLDIDVRDDLLLGNEELAEEEFERLVKTELEKYEWDKTIVVYIDQY